MWERERAANPDLLRAHHGRLRWSWRELGAGRVEFKGTEGRGSASLVPTYTGSQHAGSTGLFHLFLIGIDIQEIKETTV